MSDKTIQNTTVGTVQPGALTAIARKEDFLQHLQDFLDTHKTEKWCVAAIDVEHFRLYNELYGTEQGDTLLNTLASHLLDYQKTSGCPVGYWGNDDFFHTKLSYCIFKLKTIVIYLNNSLHFF